RRRTRIAGESPLAPAEAGVLGPEEEPVLRDSPRRELRRSQSGARPARRGRARDRDVVRGLRLYRRHHAARRGGRRTTVDVGRRVAHPESGGQRTKKSQLERILQSLDPLPNPAAPTEQYPTPADIAAGVGHSATGTGDNAGRGDIDRGCGSGVLATRPRLRGTAGRPGRDPRT